MLRTYFGYVLSEGAYVGTNDNVLGTWYVDSDETDYFDRRGRGYSSLAAAKAEVRRRCSCHCGAGPFRSKTTQVNHEMAHDGLVGWGVGR